MTRPVLAAFLSLSVCLGASHGAQYSVKIKALKAYHTKYLKSAGGNVDVFAADSLQEKYYRSSSSVLPIPLFTKKTYYEVPVLGQVLASFPFSADAQGRFEWRGTATLTASPVTVKHSVQGMLKPVSPTTSLTVKTPYEALVIQFRVQSGKYSSEDTAVIPTEIIHYLSKAGVYDTVLQHADRNAFKVEWGKLVELEIAEIR